MSTSKKTLDEAARQLPGRPSISTVWRWITRGVLTPRGTRLRLRAYRFGRRYYLDPDDIEDFGRALAEAHTQGGADSATRDPANRSSRRRREGEQ
jgi:hypothetical protein